MTSLAEVSGLCSKTLRWGRGVEGEWAEAPPKEGDLLSLTSFKLLSTYNVRVTSGWFQSFSFSSLVGVCFVLFEAGSQVSQTDFDNKDDLCQ